MKYILVDTSSIIYGFSKGKSVFEAISVQLSSRPMVSKGIINELSIISENRGRKGSCASAALKEIQLRKIRTANTTMYPDRWILKMSGKEGISVVTNDTALARKIQRNVTVLKFSINGKLRPFR